MVPRPSKRSPETRAIRDRTAERSTAVNEELKPTALSSADYSGVTTSDDLNDFLIRRQLLEMESKRIEEVLAEAEAELKNRQERLIGVRHGASTSLRVHLDQMEELARADQQARVGGLKALPKAVERYVRRGVKQLLGSRKPVSGETTAVWHLAEIRTLNAWRRWFAENDATRHKPSLFRKDRIQVALVVSGGTGDLLESTHLVGAVSDHFAATFPLLPLKVTWRKL